ncbi:MAG: glycosyltransferase family 39 protein, partial [Patescibacteria group bacterium]
MKPKVVLLLILLLAGFLRLYKLDMMELFGDELDVGYQAYSLLHTGRDYMGQLLPTYAHSFSEWRAPLLMYATVPFVAVFGLNVWGVRLPAVFFGLLGIFLTYLLAKKLFKDERVGLFSALVMAITPWSIHYSRAAFESTLLLSLVLLGTLAFLNKRWLVSALTFGLSFYTYNTANIFVPLLLLFLTVFWFPDLKQEGRRLLGPGLLFGLLLIPIGLSIISGQGRERFGLISIFNDPYTIDRVVYWRTHGLENGFAERLFHNKITGWGRQFIGNYLTAFSPQFLFLNGDLTPRHNLPGFGQLPWLLIPFLLFGAWKLVQKKFNRETGLVFVWLLISPIASCLTVGGGEQATRLFLMLFPLVILIGLGLSRIKNRLFLLAVVFLAFVNLAFWSHAYFVHYPKEEYLRWHYGYQSAFSWLAENESSFGRVMINNQYEPGLTRYLFWTKKDPVWLRENFTGDVVADQVLSGFNGFKLESVYFGGIGQEDKLSWLQQNLDPETVYLAFQLFEAPGDWDWQKQPPSGIKVLSVTR